LGPLGLALSSCSGSQPEEMNDTAGAGGEARAEPQSMRLTSY